MCYGRPLLKARLLPDLNKYLTTALGRTQTSQWLWDWLLVHVVPGSIPSKPYISGMHFFICFFVTDIVRKIFFPDLLPQPNKRARIYGRNGDLHAKCSHTSSTKQSLPFRHGQDRELFAQSLAYVVSIEIY